MSLTTSRAGRQYPATRMQEWTNLHKMQLHTCLLWRTETRPPASDMQQLLTIPSDTRRLSKRRQGELRSEGDSSSGWLECGVELGFEETADRQAVNPPSAPSSTVFSGCSLRSWQVV